MLRRLEIEFWQRRECVAFGRNLLHRTAKEGQLVEALHLDTAICPILECLDCSRTLIFCFFYGLIPCIVLWDRQARDLKVQKLRIRRGIFSLDVVRLFPIVGRALTISLAKGHTSFLHPPVFYSRSPPLMKQSNACVIS